MRISFALARSMSILNTNCVILIEESPMKSISLHTTSKDISLKTFLILIILSSYERCTRQPRQAA